MAIAHAPLSAEAHEWLGRMLLEAGFAVDASARFADAVSLGNLPALRWELAIALALDERWDEVDTAVAALSEVGVDRGLGYRLRLAAWRGVRDDETYRAFAALSDREAFERSLVLAIHDPASGWRDRRDRIRANIDAVGVASARRQAFIAQLAAEAAGAAGDVDECIAWLLRANACGLFDLHWLDRCPLLLPIRNEPRFAIIRGDVAERAHAIHDALFGDHRDEATVVTAVAGP